LAELHNGSVEVSSAGIGQGATFTVRLPLFEGSWTGVDQTVSADNSLNGRNVLLVDDDEDYLQTFASLLRKGGADVTAVAEAKTALVEATAKSFDVVISDIAMPDMDGRELITELRKLPHTRRLPAIAVSGFGRGEDLELSKLAGFDAHLNKPLSLEMLRETLLQVIAKYE
jgi:two-component system CheB/CheR fusion protein